MAHIKTLISPRTGKKSYRVYINTPHKQITKTFKKKSDAVAYGRKIEGNNDTLGILANPLLEQTFSEAIKDFTYSGNDADIYHRLEVFAEDLGHLKLCNISEGHIEMVLKKLDKKLAPATVNRYKATFGTFAKSISKKWYPHRDIDKRKEPPGRKDYLSVKQQKNLLAEAKKIDKDNGWSKLYLLLLMALATGCRRGELMALRWRDIQWTDRMAIIRAEEAGAQKTGYREVPLTPALIKELQQHRKFNGLIFANNFDEDVAFEFSKQWYKCRSNANLPDSFVLHSLRHTAASNLAKAGNSLFQIGVILGHKSTQTTLRYSHLVERKTLHKITSGAMAHLS